ncbi:MAG: SGNH/GDSL hydrolase family protein, partial [Xanthomonadales bacterium]|nr:SGNH/GDSL hydrolase family protein [Xanthomonadales bacterium]
MCQYLKISTLFLSLLLTAAPLQAARILVIGDSWGVAAGPSLQQVLIDNGSTDSVASIAVGGETAENVNTSGWLQQITTALEQNPDADFVHLSLGGNDFLGHWSSFISQAEEDQLIADILEDITAIVDHILEQRPAIRIYWSSYDFPRPLFIGTPLDVNNASMRFSEKAQALADTKGDALVYGDFNGLTQVEYGFDGIQTSTFDPDFPIPPGDPSLPDPQYPGPAGAYADPIHLTEEAFLMLAGNQYEQFYQAALNFQINAGLNDAWFNRATNGQGFLIAVFPNSKQMFVAWFTFDTQRPPEDVTAFLGEPGHRWLTAQGPYDGDTAKLTIFVTEGGVFDAAQPTASTD